MSENARRKLAKLKAVDIQVLDTASHITCKIIMKSSISTIR